MKEKVKNTLIVSTFMIMATVAAIVFITELFRA
jgi:hypothetical protein